MRPSFRQAKLAFVRGNQEPSRRVLLITAPDRLVPIWGLRRPHCHAHKAGQHLVTPGMHHPASTGAVKPQEVDSGYI
jgi:hypothetical protein